MLLCRTLLRLQLWRSSKCSLALESVTREDTEHHECEQQLKDLLQVRRGTAVVLICSHASQQSCLILRFRLLDLISQLLLLQVVYEATAPVAGIKELQQH